MANYNKYGFVHQLKKRLRAIGKITTSLLKKSVEKGNERQTVMFIPHSESRIFSFKISVFALVFLWLLITGIIIFGIIAIEKSDLLLVSEKKLKEQRDKSLQNIVDLVNRVEPLQKNVSVLKNEIDKLKTISSLAKPGNVMQDSLMDKVYQFESDLYSSTDNLKEINDLERIQREIQQLNSKVKGITSTLHNLKELLRVVPSIFPVKGGGFVISGYGYRRDPINFASSFHEGLDIILHPGAPIIASADGTVRHAEYGGGRGLYVEIAHKYGFSTQYFHMASIKTYPQAIVKKGDVIGTIGTTGRSTGPHLHYQVMINNYPVDPLPYINLKTFN